jgi:hypothetical protein
VRRPRGFIHGKNWNKEEGKKEKKEKKEKKRKKDKKRPFQPHKTDDQRPAKQRRKKSAPLTIKLDEKNWH